MNSLKVLSIAVLVHGLLACSSGEEDAAAPAQPALDAAAQAMDAAGAAMAAAAAAVDSARLSAVLAAQPDPIKARYPYRHPQETLEFFGIAPGMTVVEVLPGRGWYSSILMAYLGEEGHLVGADYPVEIWPNFPFATEEFMQKRRGWVDTWPAEVAACCGDDAASVAASRIGEFPAELAGTVDAVLFIRALHNLRRFESQGAFLSRALDDTVMLLKPGGVVGVVQHEAPAERSDAWADGSRGYLKQAAVIAMFADAGLELVAQSDINANPADQPGEEDIVWRLPPSLNTSREDPALQATYEAIGESNRMTLLFRKPAGGTP